MTITKGIRLVPEVILAADPSSFSSTGLSISDGAAGHSNLAQYWLSF